MHWHVENIVSIFLYIRILAIERSSWNLWIFDEETWSIFHRFFSIVICLHQTDKFSCTKQFIMTITNEEQFSKLRKIFLFLCVCGKNLYICLHISSRNFSINFQPRTSAVALLSYHYFLALAKREREYATHRNSYKTVTSI